MRFRTLCATLICTFAMILSSATNCFGQFEDLLKITPSRANSIAFLNVEKIYASPHARKQNWLNEARVQYAKSPLYFPSAARRVVLAGEFDLRNTQTLWEASFVQMGPTINFDTVASRSGGSKEVVNDYLGVQCPNGSFCLQVSDHILASVYPGNRQYIHRWAQSIKDNQSGNLTPYLQEAYEFTKADGADTEMILAMDMTGVVEAGNLRAELDGVPFLKDAGVDLDEIVKTMTGIRGITMGIRIGDAPFGSLKVDFSDSPGAISAIGKELLLEALNQFGATIPDLEDWDARVSGNTFFLEGPLSDPGLRQIISIIEPPPMAPEAATVEDYQDTEYDEYAGLSLEAAATKEHFDASQVLLRELRTHRSETRGAQAAFYERYSRKLDNLPVLNVDEAMLEYTASLADRFREIAGVQRGMSVKSAASDKQVNANPAPSGGFYSYGRWGGSYGYYTPRSYSTQRRAASAGIIAEGAMNKSKLLQAVDAETRDIRREMSEKYGIEF